MNFSKAFGCGRITPSLEDGTAEEIFMRGLELVQRHGDNVDWKVVAKYYSRAANEVRETKQTRPRRSSLDPHPPADDSNSLARGFRRPVATSGSATQREGASSRALVPQV